MTRAYRVGVELLGPLSTPLHSGTIFGHLCWAWRALEGEQSLGAWLEQLPRDPFLISDAFPAGYLPRPVLKPSVRMQPSTLKELDQAKKAKKASFVAVDAFLRLRDRMDEAGLATALASVKAGDPAGTHRVRTAHNTIDRRTGTTPDSGGLYFTHSEWPSDKSGRFDVYVATSLAPDKLERLFALMGEWGYGKDASVGRGRLKCTLEAANETLFAAPGTRRMTLSHGTLTPNMGDARYKLRTQYGKVGSVYSMSLSPFKYPVTLVRPGATFAPEGDGPFGELLSGVHPSLAHVRHNAWHLTIPFSPAE